jgi:hypothetical protein
VRPVLNRDRAGRAAVEVEPAGALDGQVTTIAV